MIKSEDLSETNSLENWFSFIVFSTPQTWSEDASNIFTNLNEQKIGMIPHYTMRGINDSVVIINFRFLKKGEMNNQNLIDLLSKYSYSFYKPEYIDYFPWIKSPNDVLSWSKEKSITLHEISKFVTNINHYDEIQRLSWSHLFANMMCVQDIMKIVYTSENTEWICEPYCDRSNETTLKLLKSMQEQRFPIGLP